MLITNFASGELSENLYGRVDLQQYYQGCSKLINFDIIPTGGIKKRTGLKRLAEISGDCILIPFIIDKNTSYILEVKPYEISVWHLVGNSFTVAGTITTEYTSLADIRELHYTQNYDTLVIVHRNYQPFVIRYKNGVFTSEKMDFVFYPIAGVNIDDDYDFIMLPSGTNAALPVIMQTLDGHLKFKYMIEETEIIKEYPAGTKTVYCILNGRLYEYTNKWDVSGNDPEIDINLFSADNKYPGCAAFYNNRLYLGSTKNGRQKIWASCAPSAADNRYNDFSTYQKYVTVNQVVKEADLHVFSCDISLADITTSSDGSTTTLRNVTQNFTLSGNLLKNITEYYVTGTYIPVGTKVLSVTADTIVIDTAATITEDVINQVCSIQLWRNADAVSGEDYELQVVNQNITTPDCSFNFELASDENDAIQFLSSGRYLAIGTESSIWSIDPQVNALNISAVMQGRYGSDDLQGHAVASAQIYFAQGKKGIREFYYDNASEAFQTNNIAILAEQMLEESEIIDFDYITNPYNRLLCLRSDGVIAQLLYDKTNGIMGWSRIRRDKGFIRNIAVTRGNDQYDLTYFLVEDNDRYYIELQDNTQKVYLDSWKKYDRTKSNPADGYTSGAVLWNKTTQKECDAFNIPPGFIESKSDEVFIGYKYMSDIKSLPVLTNNTTGKKRITSLLVRMSDSAMPKMKCAEKEETFSGVTVPFSGIVKMTYPGVYDRDVFFEIQSDLPQEIKILAVNAELAD